MYPVLKKLSTLALTVVLCSMTATTVFAEEPKPTYYRQLDSSYVNLTTATTTTDSGTKDETLTMSPAMRALVVESVQQGELPTKSEMKGLTEEQKAAVTAEVERLLKEKEAQENAKNGAPIQNIFSEYWVQFLALIVSVIGVALAVSGFSLASAKKKKHISKYMNEIDDAFSSFKWKSKRCEAELYRLHDIIEEKLKEGKLDESSYQLLSNRIEKYLKEVQDVDGIPNTPNNKKTV